MIYGTSDGLDVAEPGALGPCGIHASYECCDRAAWPPRADSCPPSKVGLGRRAFDGRAITHPLKKEVELNSVMRGGAYAAGEPLGAHCCSRLPLQY
jgi:hypothetical protein